MNSIIGNTTLPQRRSDLEQTKPQLCKKKLATESLSDDFVVYF